MYIGICELKLSMGLTSALLLGVLVSSGYLCCTWAHVQDLSDDSFDEQISSDDGIWIVKFTAPVCA